MATDSDSAIVATDELPKAYDGLDDTIFRNAKHLPTAPKMRGISLVQHEAGDVLPLLFNGEQRRACPRRGFRMDRDAGKGDRPVRKLLAGAEISMVSRTQGRRSQGARGRHAPISVDAL
ncbi:hypothetical protein [Mesorhizobium sp. M1329]|uniref:hypothetical protein n=1 Tax=Mesorhizobium sp. M1329 TaxID=2957083 RepID=UPI0033367B33